MTKINPALLDELERCLDMVESSSNLDHEYIHGFGVDYIRTSTLRALLELARSTQ